MFHSRGLPRGHPLHPSGSKVLQYAAPLNEGALQRLLSRTEVELADPDGVRRREMIAQLKHVAALTGAEHA